jgi:threonyl-tRNA synthetase
MSNTSYPLSTIRHSAAHLMAAAIARLFKDVQFGVGPPLENGFYYDVRLADGATLHEEDLRRIEAMMLKIQAEKLPFVRTEIAIDDAIKRMQDMGQSYKVELLQLLKTKGSTAVSREVGDELADPDATEIKEVSFYSLGDFVDLCRGPHVEHSGQTGVFKLYNIAAAFWRGDAKNDTLLRVYGLCYENNKAVRAEEKRIEECKAFDHRKLGAKYNLFFFEPQEVGVGLGFWTPGGTVIRQELENLAKEFERADGYQPITTPELAHEHLYERSGHVPYYQEDMYNAIDIEGQNYRLRPMNCPHHHMMYLHQLWSYRQLPVRFSEYGKVFRYEPSGTLTGLMRTRSFCQNDAHIYCRPDQAKDLFLEVMRLHARYYDLFGIKEYYMHLSLPDMDNLEKYVDRPEQWRKAVEIIQAAMQESGLPYEEVPGEAAFYGPKVDFQIKNALGNEFTISTNQLDFFAAERFNLSYQGEDGQRHPVYVIHRAPLGSHERFTAFLLEHYKGIFPLWLAPEQLRIITVAEDDALKAYAQKVYNFLFSANVPTATGGLRIHLDKSNETLNKKVRMAQQAAIPYIIVIGNREVENNTLSIRLRNNRSITLPVDVFLQRLHAEISQRADWSRQEEVSITKQKAVDFSNFSHVE